MSKNTTFITGSSVPSSGYFGLSTISGSGVVTLTVPHGLGYIPSKVKITQVGGEYGTASTSSGNAYRTEAITGGSTGIIYGYSKQAGTPSYINQNVPFLIGNGIMVIKGDAVSGENDVYLLSIDSTNITFTMNQIISKTFDFMIEAQ